MTNDALKADEQKYNSHKDQSDDQLDTCGHMSAIEVFRNQHLLDRCSERPSSEVGAAEEIHESFYTISVGLSLVVEISSPSAPPLKLPSERKTMGFSLGSRDKARFPGLTSQRMVFPFSLQMTYLIQSDLEADEALLLRPKQGICSEMWQVQALEKASNFPK
eukprot:CAMPEP_0184649780 /NCGR_PEP_ID=MMETSP0308-20130426/7196_1 /TAXON_ID=38269 /ORGANISM="Gloeochaete witrockiana, Strain SAG 46.84" /LENGTH=161 /DNA_ID=CAMNT_0027082767 /DNA_START=352 /DNA_END=839 /DNA_ORIENTATION=-